ncbi:putative transcription factor Tesmin family [Dioscorea sansibarensis]
MLEFTHCECFASEKCCFHCKCQDCGNTTANEHGLAAVRMNLLANNPNVFDSRIVGEGLKKGCTCRHSCCIKGYCVCKADNVKCTNKCTCKNCKNPFGARDYGQIIGPGEVNAPIELDNLAQNVPVGQILVPIQSPNETPMDVHANETVNTAQVTSCAENSPNLTNPSNNNDDDDSSGPQTQSPGPNLN